MAIEISFVRLYIVSNGLLEFINEIAVYLTTQTLKK